MALGGCPGWLGKLGGGSGRAWAVVSHGVLLLAPLMVLLALMPMAGTVMLLTLLTDGLGDDEEGIQCVPLALGHGVYLVADRGGHGPGAGDVTP